MIKDAQGKEVSIGDKVAYVKHGCMQILFGTVESFTPKSVKLVSGITRLPEYFVVIESEEVQEQEALLEQSYSEIMYAKESKAIRDAQRVINLGE